MAACPIPGLFSTPMVREFLVALIGLQKSLINYLYIGGTFDPFESIQHLIFSCMFLTEIQFSRALNQISVDSIHSHHSYGQNNSGAVFHPPALYIEFSLLPWHLQAALRSSMRIDLLVGTLKPFLGRPHFDLFF